MAALETTSESSSDENDEDEETKRDRRRQREKKQVQKCRKLEEITQTLTAPQIVGSSESSGGDGNASDMFKKVRSGWDEAPTAAAAALPNAQFQRGALPQKDASTATLGRADAVLPKMPPMVSSSQFAMMAQRLPSNHVPHKTEVDPKCRIWFGNLLRGTVDGETLNDFLVDLFDKIPLWHERYPQLVHRRTLCNNHDLSKI